MKHNQKQNRIKKAFFLVIGKWKLDSSKYNSFYINFKNDKSGEIIPIDNLNEFSSYINLLFRNIKIFNYKYMNNIRDLKFSISSGIFGLEYIDFSYYFITNKKIKICLSRHLEYVFKISTDRSHSLFLILHQILIDGTKLTLIGNKPKLKFVKDCDKLGKRTIIFQITKKQVKQFRSGHGYNYYYNMSLSEKYPYLEWSDKECVAALIGTTIISNEATTIISKELYKRNEMTINSKGFLFNKKYQIISDNIQVGLWRKSIIKNNDNTNSVHDIDGNVYKTVKIGDQWWMAENLKVTRYCNGDRILKNCENLDKNSNTGTYYCYNNDIKNAEKYGNLYDWNVVNDNRKLAPEGWHIPTKHEWGTLTSCLGRYAGKRLKSKFGWKIQTNDYYGFSALPAGFYNNGYNDIGQKAYFWSASDDYIGLKAYCYWWEKEENDEIYIQDAHNCIIDNNSIFFHWCSVDRSGYISSKYNSVIWEQSNKKFGFSIRCIKDQDN